MSFIPGFSIIPYLGPVSSAIASVQSILSSAAQYISSFFSTIKGNVMDIANTGQGIFAGLASFGSMVWDALGKLGSWLSTGFSLGGLNIGMGLMYGLSGLGQFLVNALIPIATGIGGVGFGLNSMSLAILYSSVSGFNMLAMVAENLWNGVQEFVGKLWDMLRGWLRDFTVGINTWFTDLVVNARRKLVKMLKVNTTIYFGWKAQERIVRARRLEDMFMGLAAIIMSPVVGELFGNIVNSVVPTPRTQRWRFVPELDIPSMPTHRISIPRMTPPRLPDFQFPRIPGVFYGVYERYLEVSLDYISWFAYPVSRCYMGEVGLGYEYYVLNPGEIMSEINLDYEYRVARGIETSGIETVGLDHEYEVYVPTGLDVEVSG